MDNQYAQPQRKSRKKLFIIIGLVVMLPIVLTVGIVTVVFGIVFVGSKSTYEYKCALEEAGKNEKAIEILGLPMEEGFFLLPNIEISGLRREVNFSTSLTGPVGSGTLSVASYRDAFRSDFLMTLETEDRIEVLYKGSYPCSDE